MLKSALPASRKHSTIFLMSMLCSFLLIPFWSGQAFSCSFDWEALQFYAKYPEPIDPRIQHPDLESRLHDAAGLHIVKIISFSRGSHEVRIVVLQTYRDNPSRPLKHTASVRVAICDPDFFAADSLLAGQVWLFDGSFGSRNSFVIETADGSPPLLSPERRSIVLKIKSKSPLRRQDISKDVIDKYQKNRIAWELQHKQWEKQSGRGPCVPAVLHPPRKPQLENPDLESRLAEAPSVYMVEVVSHNSEEVLLIRNTYSGPLKPGDVLADPGSGRIVGQHWLIAPDLHKNDSFLLTTSNGKAARLTAEQQLIHDTVTSGYRLKIKPAGEVFKIRFEEAMAVYTVAMREFTAKEAEWRAQINGGMRVCPTLFAP